MDITFSVITPTKGRPTLAATLASVAHQLQHGDEHLILRRDNTPFGNQTRDEAIQRAAGTHLVFVDDDDTLEPGALNLIRERVAADPGTVHIFRMRYGASHDQAGDVLWDTPEVRYCHVGGSMCVVPNLPGKLGSWVRPEVYGGDFCFLTQTLRKLGREPRWHREVIQTIRP